ncbi:uncharacterized protein G2W53_025499 [Senna tora]|uniref:Uncharacterized protein n=1 Tax=Senna tora TaxID=362788 RepID=A0A834TFB9_9FABA|nr:uncharacterized protein G2W53_025499 [Senna tora]
MRHSIRSNTVPILVPFTAPVHQLFLDSDTSSRDLRVVAGVSFSEERRSRARHRVVYTGREALKQARQRWSLATEDEGIGKQEREGREGKG